MSDGILSLKEAQEKRPSERIHTFPGVGKFRIVRVPITEKLEILRFISDHLDPETGALDMGDRESDDPESANLIVHVWSCIMSRCITNADGEFEYNCPEGITFLESLCDGITQHWTEFRDAVDELNQISAKYHTEEVETAKNE